MKSAVVMGLGLALAAIACTDEAPPPPPPPEVPVVAVIQRDQPIELEMVGQTQGSADIPIRARVEGVLTGMYFIEGRNVAAGDPLYDIDPVPFQSKVVEAEGEVAESRTILAKSKSDLDRIRPLAEMNAVSQVDLDGAVSEYEAALGGLQASNERKKQAQIQLGYTKISAPIDGRIGISAAKVGEFVGREPNPVVLNFVSQTDPIRVRFSIDERRYLKIARRIRDDERQPGPRDTEGNTPAGIQLILADGTIHEHRGHIIGTSAAVDPETGTFTLEADFPNPDEIILAGQFARVRAVVEIEKGALLIPQRAISELQGTFRVFVVAEDGSVSLRPVEVGARVGKLQIIEKGLEAGELVALDIMRVKPGATIVPVLQDAEAVPSPPETESTNADGGP